MTPDPAKKSFEENYQALVERQCGFSSNTPSAHMVAFMLGATNETLLRAVRLDERAKVYNEVSVYYDDEDNDDGLYFISKAQKTKAELEALLSGGGE